MKKKVIFIDVDGPLAWATWDDGKVTIREGSHFEFQIPYPWVKEDCEALQKICDETDAELVISYVDILQTQCYLLRFVCC